MKFAEFRAIVQAYPYFRSNIFTHITDKPAVLRRQVTDWVRKGLLIELKRGMYTLAEADRGYPLSPFFIANQTYSPSYISLESALSYYQIIPERVDAITSVSSKKTQRFDNQLGHFIYKHMKQSCFNHFVAHENENKQFFLIATPEKAMVDFLYFNTHGLKKLDKSLFEGSFRFQNLSILKSHTLIDYGIEFRQKKLAKLIDLLIDYKGSY